MNKKEVQLRVSKESGVNTADCEKVLNAFEKVFEAEIAGSRGVMSAFDKIYRIMSFIKKEKKTYKQTVV